MAIPGNLLSSTTEQVDPNTSGWLPVLNCTTGLGSGGRNGPGTLLLTASSAGEMQARTAASYPVVAERTYWTFADASSSTQPERIGIRWLSAAGAEISTTWSLTTSAASASWHRVSVAGAAPGDAVTAQVVLSATTAQAGRQHHFENVYLGAPIRTTGNLLPFNTESGGEIDASGWTAANATVGRAAPAVSWPVDYYLAGGEVITITADADGDAEAVTTERPAATPGAEYLGYAYLSPPTAAADCWIELRWYDQGGAQLGAVRAVLDQPGTGLYRQRVSGVAPAGTATCGLAVGITGAAAGQALAVEGVVVSLAPQIRAGSVIPYADASFEQGTGSWSVVSGPAAIARSSPWGAAGFDGSYSLTVVAAVEGDSVIRSGRFPLGAGAGGQTWRWEVAATQASGTWTIARQARWYDADGTLLLTSTDDPGPVPTPGWWVLTNTATAPEGAVEAELEWILAGTAGAVLHLDAVTLWRSLPLTDVAVDEATASVTLTLRELPVGALLTVYRVTPDGARTLVRGPAGLLDRAPIAADLMVIEDYEAPLGAPVSYDVEIRDASTGAVTQRRSSPPVTIPPPPAGAVWLKDPANPQRNMMVALVQRGPDWTRAIERAEYRVRGRRNTVVISDVRGGLVGDLAIWTRSDAERLALHHLLDSGDTLLWQTAPSYGVGDLYVTVGDVTEARVSRLGTEPWRAWTLPLIEADMPVGGVNGSAGRTWQDVPAEAATWETVRDQYATWEALLLHQPIGAGG